MKINNKIINVETYKRFLEDEGKFNLEMNIRDFKDDIKRLKNLIKITEEELKKEATKNEKQ